MGKRRDELDDSDGWMGRFATDGRTERLYKLAYEDFCRNLERLRKIVPVKIICMHGSPRSRVSNLDLWKKYDYRGLGIIGEPYLDVDFDEVFYLTDTGRRWDGDSVSVRDKVKAQSNHLAQRRQGAERGQDELDELDDLDGWRTEDRGQKTEGRGRKTEDKKRRGLEGKKEWPRFHSTFEIIEAAKKGLLPDKIMINTHPQRWTDDPVAWTKELVWQNVKNVVKRIMVRRLRSADYADYTD